VRTQAIILKHRGLWNSARGRWRCVYAFVYACMGGLQIYSSSQTAPVSH